MTSIAKDVLMSTQKNPRFLTVNQLARRWGMHAQTVKRTIETGTLRAVRIGKREVIPMAQIERVEREMAAS